MAFGAPLLAAVAAFPDTVHHIRLALHVALGGPVLVGAILLVRFGWSLRHRPVIRIGVSLPFVEDPSDAKPMHEAMKSALGSMAGRGSSRP